MLGWYDYKQASMFKRIEHLSWTATMTSGMSRPNVSTRFLRHFALLHICECDAQSLFMYLTSVTQWILHDYLPPLQVCIYDLTKMVVI